MIEGDLLLFLLSPNKNFDNFSTWIKITCYCKDVQTKIALTLIDGHRKFFRDDNGEIQKTCVANHQFKIALSPLIVFAIQIYFILV